MSKKQYDYLVLIGRFQPFHIGHKEVIDKALTLAEKVIVLVGSSNQPRTIKNPFNFDERRNMILDAYGFSHPQLDPMSNTDFKRIMVEPLRDNRYNDQAWAVSVQTIVQDAVMKSIGWTDMPPRGGIIGSSKDETSYYLSMFPQWDLIEHSINEEVHATDIREIYFKNTIHYLYNVVPMTTYQFLEKFAKKGEFRTLRDEFEFIQKYKKAWAAAPYAPTFLTCDAVVVQSGHILLVKRKAEPGKGLWALPGGFVNQNERIEDAMIRELREETKIKVPDPVLRGNIGGLHKDKPSKVFDAPDRSLRGRTVTQAFFIELPAGTLPAVKGSDDAEKAKWVTLSHVREEEMFEDHYSIIQHFGLI